MSENSHVCPKCQKTFYNTTSITDYELLEDPDVMLCEECFHRSKGLVKVGNHYVPWNYRFYRENGINVPEDPEHFEDVNSSIPTIGWDEEFHKFTLSFAGPDYGGYDVQGFVWYFDSIADILTEMGLNKASELMIGEKK